MGRGEVTLEEAVGLAVLLQIGGEAVTSNSGQMFYLLLTRPSWCGGCAVSRRSAPGRSTNCCATSRTATRSACAGSRWRTWRSRASASARATRSTSPYLAANRDPDVFPDPETVDFARSPNPHVAFGFGPHYCPGGMLARLEEELLMDALLDRVPGLRLAVAPDQVPFRKAR